MSALSPIYRAIALPMAAVTFVAALPVPVAQAGLVATETVLDTATATAERAKVLAFLERDDVRQEMVAMGVSPEEASARVAGLSDAEVSRIAGHISQLPAGGDGVGAVLGVVFAIFIVLLITDILGLTKVFPFTRSVRR